MSRPSELPPIDEHTQRRWHLRRNDHSAGGVMYHIAPDGQIEVVLIATRSGTRWQLPKGTCEPGETIEQTALREVAEECGLIGVCEAYLGAIEYWYWDTHGRTVPELVHKRVDFYLMRAVDGELSDASIEVDGVNWFTLKQAMDALTYPSEREIVRKAAAHLGCSI